MTKTVAQSKTRVGRSSPRTGLGLAHPVDSGLRHRGDYLDRALRRSGRHDIDHFAKAALLACSPSARAQLSLAPGRQAPGQPRPDGLPAAPEQASRLAPIG